MSQSGSTTRTVGSLGSSTDSGGGGGGGGSYSFSNKKDQRNKQRKIVRILTVAAYMISVSAIALVLSAYYLLIWKPASPTEPFRMRKTGVTDSPLATSSLYNHHSPASQNPPFPISFGNERNLYRQRNNKQRPFNMLPTPQSHILQEGIISTEEFVELEGKSTATPQRAPASAPEREKLSKTTPHLLKIIAPTRATAHLPWEE